MGGDSETRLALRVSPGAQTSAVVGRQGDRWKLRVAAPAESGKANHAVVALLSEVLAVPRSRIRLIQGFTSRDKVAALAGIEPEESERRLAAAQARKAGGRR
jgi:uncharacterized protein YggU (UPF0235/DUF167 family)